MINKWYLVGFTLLGYNASMFLVFIIAAAFSPNHIITVDFNSVGEYWIELIFALTSTMISIITLTKGRQIEKKSIHC
jgi:hypothetical protein